MAGLDVRELLEVTRVNPQEKALHSASTWFLKYTAKGIQESARLGSPLITNAGSFIYYLTIPVVGKVTFFNPLSLIGTAGGLFLEKGVTQDDDAKRFSMSFKLGLNVVTSVLLGGPLLGAVTAVTGVLAFIDKLDELEAKKREKELNERLGFHLEHCRRIAMKRREAMLAKEMFKGTGSSKSFKLNGIPHFTSLFTELYMLRDDKAVPAGAGYWEYLRSLRDAYDFHDETTDEQARLATEHLALRYEHWHGRYAKEAKIDLGKLISLVLEKQSTKAMAEIESLDWADVDDETPDLDKQASLGKSMIAFKNPFKAK